MPWWPLPRAGPVRLPEQKLISHCNIIKILNFFSNNEPSISALIYRDGNGTGFSDFPLCPVPNRQLMRLVYGVGAGAE